MSTTGVARSAEPRSPESGISQGNETAKSAKGGREFNRQDAKSAKGGDDRWGHDLSGMDGRDRAYGLCQTLNLVVRSLSHPFFLGVLGVLAVPPPWRPWRLGGCLSWRLGGSSFAPAIVVGKLFRFTVAANSPDVSAFPPPNTPLRPLREALRFRMGRARAETREGGDGEGIHLLFTSIVEQESGGDSAFALRSSRYIKLESGAADPLEVFDPDWVIPRLKCQ